MSEISKTSMNIILLSIDLLETNEEISILQKSLSDKYREINDLIASVEDTGPAPRFY